MKITGTYVWSASVEVEGPDDATDEQQREALDNAAIGVKLDLAHPILHVCSNEDLIEYPDSFNFLYNCY